MRENIFVITTGRSYYSIYPLLVKNNIPYNYLICNNGAMVFDANNNIIESNPLPQDEIEKIKKIILENKKNTKNFVGQMHLVKNMQFMNL